MKKYTKHQLNAIVKEETKTSKEYKAHGYPRLAAAEQQHANFFKMQLKRK